MIRSVVENPRLLAVIAGVCLLFVLVCRRTLVRPVDRAAARNSSRYRDLRAERLAQTGGYCEDCGDWHESAALHFHHLNDAAYGNEHHGNMALICAPCHRRRHG